MGTRRDEAEKCPRVRKPIATLSVPPSGRYQASDSVVLGAILPTIPQQRTNIRADGHFEGGVRAEYGRARTRRRVLRGGSAARDERDPDQDVPNAGFPHHR